MNSKKYTLYLKAVLNIRLLNILTCNLCVNIFTLKYLDKIQFSFIHIRCFSVIP